MWCARSHVYIRYKYKDIFSKKKEKKLESLFSCCIGQWPRNQHRIQFYWYYLFFLLLRSFFEVSVPSIVFIFFSFLFIYRCPFVWLLNIFQFQIFISKHRISFALIRCIHIHVLIISIWKQWTSLPYRFSGTVCVRMCVFSLWAS